MEKNKIYNNKTRAINSDKSIIAVEAGVPCQSLRGSQVPWKFGSVRHRSLLHLIQG